MPPTPGKSLETVEQVELFMKDHSGPNENKDPFRYFYCDSYNITAINESWRAICPHDDMESVYLIDKEGFIIEQYHIQ